MKDEYVVAAWAKTEDEPCVWLLRKNGKTVAEFAAKADAEFARDFFESDRESWEARVRTLPEPVQSLVLGEWGIVLRRGRAAYQSSSWVVGDPWDDGEADEPVVVG